MVITPHMLVGAAIGAQASNFWSVFLLGTVSHYLLDALPHWDYLYKVKINNPNHIMKIGLDFILGSVLILILSWSSPVKILILIGAIAALLPDIAEVLYSNFKLACLKWSSEFHRKIHNSKRISFWPGLLLMLLVSLTAVCFLSG